MTRLSKDDWNLLDDLLGRHGFGGYYDLVECLKMVAGDLGMGMTGLNTSDNMSLPQIVQFLQDWVGLISKDDQFTAIAERCGQGSVIERGAESHGDKLTLEDSGK